MNDEQIDVLRTFIQDNFDALASFAQNNLDSFDNNDEAHEKAYKTQAIKGYKEYQAACSKLTGPYSGRMRVINKIINETALEKYSSTTGSDKFSKLLNDEETLKVYGSYLVTLLNLTEVDGKVLTTHGCKTVVGLAAAVLDPINMYLKTT